MYNSVNVVAHIQYMAHMCRTCALQDIWHIATVGNRYQLKTKNWLSPKNDSDDDKGHPNAAFNVLDAMLKGSLERLKTMRLAFDFKIKLTVILKVASIAAEAMVKK